MIMAAVDISDAGRYFQLLRDDSEELALPFRGCTSWSSREPGLDLVVLPSKTVTSRPLLMPAELGDDQF